SSGRRVGGRFDGRVTSTTDLSVVAANLHVLTVTLDLDDLTLKTVLRRADAVTFEESSTVRVSDVLASVRCDLDYAVLRLKLVGDVRVVVTRKFLGRTVVVIARRAGRRSVTARPVDDGRPRARAYDTLVRETLAGLVVNPLAARVLREAALFAVLNT